MEKFVVLADTTCDMTTPLRERFGVPELIPGNIVFPDGHSELVSCDWENISKEKFYELLKNKKNVFSTAAPSPERFEEVFRKYLDNGQDILFVSISSALSGTYQFALAASKELATEYPDRKVLVVDSKRYSTAELLLIITACTFAKEGKGIEETFAEVEKVKNCLHQAGPMDDLKFLASKGRISNAKAFMGTIIGINPFGEFDSNGMSRVLGKVKGSKKALETTLEYMRRTIIDPQNQIVVIAHSNRKEKAEMYRKMIEETIKPKEIIMTEIGLSCAPNVGPGLCAAYYYGTEISQDLVEEQKLVNEILGKK